MRRNIGRGRWGRAGAILLLTAGTLLLAVPDSPAQTSFSRIVTYAPPGGGPSVRFPVPDDLCPADRSRSNERIQLEAVEAVMPREDLVGVFVPCGRSGYGLVGIANRGGSEREVLVQRTGTSRTMEPKELDRLVTDSAALSVARAVRADIEKWDDEIRAVLSGMAVGSSQSFAALPANGSGNFHILVERPRANSEQLVVNSALKFDGHTYLISTSYSDFSKTSLTAKRAVDEQRKWVDAAYRMNR